MIAPRHLRVDGDEEVAREVLWIDHSHATVGRVREDLELGADANVVAVAGNAVGNDAASLAAFLEWLDAHEFTDLRVAQNAHLKVSS